MGGKKGFTLVEMMVVMAIIAILAVIGLSALININRGNVVDRATEEIVTAIRESQNKAISVASSPSGSTSIPLAWGFQANAGAKTVNLFVITDFLATGVVTKTSYSSIDISALDSIAIDGDSQLFYTTPFGKYYSVATNTDEGWSKNSQRPYDLIPPVRATKKTTITLTYRGNSRVVIIETNGDVHAQ